VEFPDRRAEKPLKKSSSLLIMPKKPCQPQGFFGIQGQKRPARRGKNSLFRFRRGRACFRAGEIPFPMSDGREFLPDLSPQGRNPASGIIFGRIS